MTASLLLIAVLAAKPLTVSVMPFDNRTGAAEYDVMEKGLADMLLTDLSAADGLVAVERQRLADVIGELKLQRSALFDPATAQRIGRLVGATHLVTGQLLKVDPEVRLDVRLVEVSSGKVLYGSNVAGRADRFFDLEQELVTRFLAGLGKKGVLATRSGPAKLETMLAYSQALAQADEGNLKEASTALAAVMQTDSDFRLAKDRYADLLKRLRDAGQRREEVLTSGEQELLTRIDQMLSRPLDTKKSSDVSQYLGYRAMRANFALMRLARVVGPPSLPSIGGTTRLVKKSQRPDARPLLQSYFDGVVMYLKECERLGDDADATPDHARAVELGLGDADKLYDGAWGYVSLADFVFRGENRNYEVMRKLSPTPAQIEPRLVEPGLQLYVRAAELASAQQSDRLNMMSTVAVSHGDALLALGRKEDALARWQRALDEMPTSPKYKDIEERIERTLGVHAQWKSLDAAMRTCDMNTQTAWMMSGFQLYAYDREALFARAEKVPKLCGKKGQQAYFVPMGFKAIAMAAGSAGDCPGFNRALARTRQLSPSGAVEIEGYARACADIDR